MDTYAVLIGIITAYFIGGQARSDDRQKGRAIQVKTDESQLQIRSWPVLTIAVVIPILFLIPLLYPHPKYNENINQGAYQQLIQMVSEAGKNGPILFINERQLVTLGDINVPLVYDYEVVTLMEMAMSGNQAYLDRFYNDLSTHRFAGIVATKQNTGIKEAGAFYEENNVWNSHVSPYILCYYTPVLTLEPEGNRIEFYRPAAEAQDCP